MIQIFNGRSRGLGQDAQHAVYLQVSVQMRQHLYHFKGARLGVFLAITCTAMPTAGPGRASPCSRPRPATTSRRFPARQWTIPHHTLLSYTGWSRWPAASAPAALE